MMTRTLLFCGVYLVSMATAMMAPVMAQEYSDTDIVSVRILDKVTARSRTFDLDVGQTVTYGNLRIKPRACKKASPLDEPESASFLQIWEVGIRGERSWIFSGWMYASSPSLSAMDHPVYDVWVIDCVAPEKAQISDNDTVVPSQLSADENDGDVPVDNAP